MRVFSALGAILATGLFAGAAAASGPLVDTDWLAEHKDREDVVVLDIRNAIDGGDYETFTQGHIPGAVYSNYLEDGWRIERDGVPGVMPDIADLETLIGGLGIGNDTHVVVQPAGVSSTDFGSATRVYWTFKALGHDKVSILEGGYAAWTQAGHEVAEGAGANPEPAQFDGQFREAVFAGLREANAAREDAGIALIDARPVGHYTGEETPGNVGVAGTIPTAVNIPHDMLVLEDGHKVVDAEQVAAYLDQLGLDNEGPQVAFCNTGHWASVGWFLLSEIGGNTSVTMYDGSMVEWVQYDQLPIEVGADRTVAN